jgi:hypothetical protein
MNLVFYILLVVLVIIVIGTHFASGVSRRRTQHEADIRLPYKKYRELYPHTTFTYEQYKLMQARDAFRTVIPSKKLIRMVR